MSTLSTIFNVRNSLQIIFLCLVIGVLSVLSQYNYLLFHSLVELFSVIIAGFIFILAWNTRPYTENYYIHFLGFAYLFVALLDIVHTLTYKGMGIFPEYGADLSTQLWIVSRYLESLSLLAGLFFLNRSFSVWKVLAIYLLVTGCSLFLVFEGLFPECFVENQGLTLFKRLSEFIIIIFLLSSIFLLYLKKNSFDSHVLYWLIAGVSFTILAEISFTLYTHVYGLSNLIGHFCKLISFFFIYKGIVETGLKKPFALLFSDLKKSNQLLEQSEARYRSIFDNAPIGIAQFTPSGKILNRNPFFRDLFKINDHNTAKKIDEILPLSAKDKESLFQQLDRHGEVKDFIFQLPQESQQEIWGILQIPVRNESIDNQQAYDVFIVDISRLKESEKALQQEKDFTQAIVETAAALIVVFDRDGRIVRFNQTSQLLTGYIDEEVKGDFVWDRFSANEEKDQFRSLFQELSSCRSSRRVNQSWFTKNGERLHIAWSYTCFFDQSGGLNYIIGIGIDITEQVRYYWARDREISSLQDFSDTKHTEATAESLQSEPLNKKVPELFDQLVETLGDLLDQSLDMARYKVNHNVSEKLRYMAEQLGNYQAGPKDVVKIYMTVLQPRLKGSFSKKDQAVIDEGRMLLIELMGYLASYYQTFCLFR